MGPELSVSGTMNLEETIAKVYETLKRTENRTLDTKRKATKALEDSSQHLSRLKQFQASTLKSDRFSKSPYHSSGIRNEVDSMTPQYFTVGSKRENLSAPQNIPPNSSNNGGTRKAPINRSKLRTVIFNTLDKLFLASNKPSIQHQKKAIAKVSPKNSNDDPLLSFETLKSLNQNAADTLPRNSSLSNEENESFLTPKDATNTLACSLDDESSSEDDSWEFIAPLKVTEVAIDVTMDLSLSQTSKVEQENDSSLQQKEERRYYQKRSKRGSEKNKIQKRAFERQTEKLKTEIHKPSIVLGEVPQAASQTPLKLRPDSPVSKRKVCLPSAVSLPNLMEEIQDLAHNSSGTISDCGTNSFMRKISYRPSSTLKKTPSFAENHENDDDACSTSSSFSSMQMMPAYESTGRSAHESTLPIPSALCKDILVRPINVPIQPFPQNGSETTVHLRMHRPFQELSQVFIPATTSEAINEPIRQKNQEDNFECGSSKFVAERISENISSTSEQNVTTPLNYPSVPPPPPPMPPSHPPPTATIRGLLPLPIFTQRQEGNCIFNEMKDIQIEARDAKELQEKFPLKPQSKARKGFLGRTKLHELSPTEKKFLQNIELVVRTYRISNDRAARVIQSTVKCIQSLNTKTDEVEMDWFNMLAQSIPKVEEIVKMQRDGNLQKSGKKTTAKELVAELLSVQNLHGKLKCIQFSLDFKDGCSKLLNWIESFIAACDDIKMSEKFVSIINVIMGLLQQLNPDDQSQIYGFDIQGLTRLATRTSEDGSTTFLQFVIEYILNRPDLKSSIDFYEKFKDLPDISKTSIKEMRAQCQEWKQSLSLYEKQVELIQKQNQIAFEDLDCATEFLKKTEARLRQLDAKLDEAQQSFNSCKERFGLMNSETTEAIFFESLSKFVMAYQKTYNEIIAQREKVNKQNTVTANKKAKSSRIVQAGGSENVPSQTDVISRRRTCTEAEIQNLRRDAAAKAKNPIKVNPRRKSCTHMDMIDTPASTETAEVENCLLRLLTKNENGNCGISKRLRQRPSKSPSKIPIRK